MEFIKNKVQEIWSDQAFVSSQMDGVKSRLVALEKVAASFSHFIIEHWVPTQAILIDLHNSTCPLCQRADGIVELEADYRSYGSPAIAHKRAKHSAHKPIDRINLRLVHHVLYCAT